MKRKFKGLLIAFAVCAVSAVAVMASGCNLTETIKQKIEQSRCEHTFDSGEEAKAATCIAVGEMKYTCTECGFEKIEEIAKVAHSEIEVEGKASTCLEAGYNEGVKCAVCDTVISGLETIPAGGHKRVTDEAVKATCTESGLTKGSHCEKCDEVFEKQEVIPAKGHNILTVKGYSPTCDKDGKTDGYKCSACDFVLAEQETLAKYGHDYDDGVVAQKATCVSKGVMRYTCKTCGAMDNQEIAATGIHTVVTVNGYPATCTASGLTNGQKCSDCNEVISEREVIAATGHIYDSGTVKKAATCGTSGVMRYTCTECGGVRDETINATGNHKAVTVDGKAATCTETGLTSGQNCSVCGIVLTAQEETPMLDHIYDEGVLTEAATCLTYDIMTYTCSECGGTKSEALTTKGSHNDNGEGACKLCGLVFELTEESLATATFAAVNAVDSLGGWYRVSVPYGVRMQYNSLVFDESIYVYEDIDDGTGYIGTTLEIVDANKNVASQMLGSYVIFNSSAIGALDIETFGLKGDSSSANDYTMNGTFSDVEGLIHKTVGEVNYIYIPKAVTATYTLSDGNFLPSDFSCNVTFSDFRATLDSCGYMEKITFNG